MSDTDDDIDEGIGDIEDEDIEDDIALDIGTTTDGAAVAEDVRIDVAAVDDAPDTDATVDAVDELVDERRAV